MVRAGSTPAWMHSFLMFNLLVVLFTVDALSGTVLCTSMLCSHEGRTVVDRTMNDVKRHTYTYIHNI